MNEENKFSVILLKNMEERKTDPEKLAGLTAVPKRFIEMLTNENFDKLPPAPYVRGYILKIAEAMEIDGGHLWQTYLKNHPSLKRSGLSDKMPENRFNLTRLSKKFIFLIAAALLLSGYLIARKDELIGKPALYLATPLQDNMVVSKEKLTLQGKIEPRDKLTINGQEVYLEENGKFEKEILLKPGLNAVEIKVSRFLGTQTVIAKQIFYSP